MFLSEISGGKRKQKQQEENQAGDTILETVPFKKVN